jgi:hypothetical protein
MEVAQMDPANSDTQHRTSELIGMLMIGDAVLGLLRPAEHCRVWQAGRGRWRDMVEWFATHPELTRAVAVAELGAGLWLASQVEDGTPQPLVAGCS